MHHVLGTCMKMEGCDGSGDFFPAYDRQGKFIGLYKVTRAGCAVHCTPNFVRHEEVQTVERQYHALRTIPVDERLRRSTRMFRMTVGTVQRDSDENIGIYLMSQNHELKPAVSDAQGVSFPSGKIPVRSPLQAKLPRAFSVFPPLPLLLSQRCFRRVPRA